MKMKLSLRIVMIVVPLLVIAVFQNCGAQKSGVKNEKSSHSLDDGELVENCLSKTGDACLFEKNLTAQTGLAGDADFDEAVEHQNFAVQLSMSDGDLANDDFAVFRKGSSVPLSSGSKKFRFSATSAEIASLNQVSAFYWANFLKDNWAARSGTNYLSEKAVKIVTDDNLAGWNADLNQIHLKIGEGTRGMALDAGVIAYYLAMAHMTYATGGALHFYSSVKDKSCGGARKNCCLASTGCARAVASGVADFMAAISFPNAPAVGDGWSANVEGHSICGGADYRNPAKSVGLNVTKAFGLCSGQGRPGDIHALGAVFAAALWDLRAANDAEEIDQLVMIFMAVLHGDDDFASAKSKLLLKDVQVFGGKYQSSINSVFSARGL